MGNNNVGFLAIKNVGVLANNGAGFIKSSPVVSKNERGQNAPEYTIFANSLCPFRHTLVFYRYSDSPE